MHSSKGFAKVWAIAVILLLLTALVTAFVFFRSNTEPLVTVESVTRILETDSRADGVQPTDVVIQKQASRYIRGTVIDGRDGTQKTFYAMLAGDVWRIVAVTSTAMSCERLARLGFPDDFLTGCMLTFADAVTVAEIDATLDAQLLTGVSLQVIGFVTDVETVDEGTVITLTSGGETETFIVSTPTLSVGDLAVVTVDVAQQTSGGSRQGTYTLTTTSVETVGSEDAALVTATTQPTTLPQEQSSTSNTNTTTNTPVTGAGGTTIYKINAPKVAPPPQYFFNVYDVDTSFENIRIEGSF